MGDSSDDDKPSRGKASGIQFPGVHDVLCGRGGHAAGHPGNVKFRTLVESHKPRNAEATRYQKSQVATKVVRLWSAQNPPGRFLTVSEDDCNLWIEIADKAAILKTSQALRERTPKADFGLFPPSTSTNAPHPYTQQPNPYASYPMVAGMTMRMGAAYAIPTMAVGMRAAPATYPAHMMNSYPSQGRNQQTSKAFSSMEDPQSQQLDQLVQQKVREAEQQVQQAHVQVQAQQAQLEHALQIRTVLDQHMIVRQLLLVQQAHQQQQSSQLQQTRQLQPQAQQVSSSFQQQPIAQQTQLQQLIPQQHQGQKQSQQQLIQQQNSQQCIQQSQQQVMPQQASSNLQQPVAQLQHQQQVAQPTLHISTNAQQPQAQKQQLMPRSQNRAQTQTKEQASSNLLQQQLDLFSANAQPQRRCGAPDSFYGPSIGCGSIPLSVSTAHQARPVSSSSEPSEAENTSPRITSDDDDNKARVETYAELAKFFSSDDANNNSNGSSDEQQSSDDSAASPSQTRSVKLLADPSNSNGSSDDAGLEERMSVATATKLVKHAFSSSSDDDPNQRYSDESAASGSIQGKASRLLRWSIESFSDTASDKSSNRSGGGRHSSESGAGSDWGRSSSFSWRNQEQHRKKRRASQVPQDQDDTSSEMSSSGSEERSGGSECDDGDRSSSSTSANQEQVHRKHGCACRNPGVLTSWMSQEQRRKHGRSSQPQDNTAAENGAGSCRRQGGAGIRWDCTSTSSSVSAKREREHRKHRRVNKS